MLDAPKQRVPVVALHRKRAAVREHKSADVDRQPQGMPAQKRHGLASQTRAAIAVEATGHQLAHPELDQQRRMLHQGKGHVTIHDGGTRSPVDGPHQQTPKAHLRHHDRCGDPADRARQQLMLNPCPIERRQTPTPAVTHGRRRGPCPSGWHVDRTHGHGCPVRMGCRRAAQAHDGQQHPTHHRR